MCRVYCTFGRLTICVNLYRIYQKLYLQINIFTSEQYRFISSNLYYTFIISEVRKIRLHSS